MTNPSMFDFYQTLMGPRGERQVSQSSDGNSTTFTGEIGGVPISMSVRPSNSTGYAVDAKVGESLIRHIKG